MITFVNEANVNVYLIFRTLFYVPIVVFLYIICYICFSSSDNFYDGWYPPPGVEKDDQNVTDPTLFNKAQIKCGPVPEHVRHCGGKGFEPCLFNITADPCEYYDLSEKFPDVYQMMLDKLEEYHKGMVPAKFNSTTDPQSNPKLHNGVWEPWAVLDKTEEDGTIQSFP